MFKSVLFSFLFAILFMEARTQTIHAEESWWDYLNQNRFSDHWGSWVDIQTKRKEHYVDAINANEFTLGASYFYNNQFKYT